MKAILTAVAIAVSAFALAPSSAQAGTPRCGICNAHLHTQRVVVGYQRCGTPIYRTVARPCNRNHSSYYNRSRSYNSYRSYGNSYRSYGNHYRGNSCNIPRNGVTIRGRNGSISFRSY